MATINDAQLREILTSSPTIAVLGVHREPEKSAYYVPEYLHDEGYRIIGVNPVYAGQELFGVGEEFRSPPPALQRRDLEHQPLAAGNHGGGLTLGRL